TSQRAAIAHPRSSVLRSRSCSNRLQQFNPVGKLRAIWGGNCVVLIGTGRFDAVAKLCVHEFEESMGRGLSKSRAMLEYKQFAGCHQATSSRVVQVKHIAQ